MEVPEAPGASESDPGGGRRGARIERLRAALSLPTLRRATGLLDGRHKSVFVGRGQDFDDMSFYRPGDDISDIDWKSSARLGQPVIKRYQRESMMSMVLAVDTGRTMAAMAPSGEDKRDLALGVAEVFAYLARMRGDSVALVAGDSGRTISRPARSGAKHVETLADAAGPNLRGPRRSRRGGARWLLRAGARAPASSLPRLMERVSTWHRRRSLVVLITDTAHPGPDCATWLRRLSIQHEVIVVQIEDDDPLRPAAAVAGTSTCRWRSPPSCAPTSTWRIRPPRCASSGGPPSSRCSRPGTWSTASSPPRRLSSTPLPSSSSASAPRWPEGGDERCRYCPRFSCRCG